MLTLAQYLKEQKMTQRGFAGEIGISPSYMNEIVQRVKSPSIQVAARIEALTGGAVSISALLVEPCAGNSSADDQPNDDQSYAALAPEKGAA
ncbi:helix-turn-helix domain-containing protein [Roseinatronobacter sp.]